MSKNSPSAKKADATHKKAEAAAKAEAYFRQQVKDFLAFEDVFGNTGRYQNDATLLNALQPQGFKTLEAIYDYAEDYRDFRIGERKKLANYNLSLPDLPYRKKGRHAFEATWPSVVAQLADFEVDYPALNDADGLIVTGAQFDGLINTPTWQGLKALQRFYKRELKKTYAIVVLPIAFGHIYYEEDTGELVGSFPQEVKGHMVMRDTWVGR